MCEPPQESNFLFESVLNILCSKVFVRIFFGFFGFLDAIREPSLAFAGHNLQVPDQ